MSESASRRNFLRGKFSARPAALRPPWALSEQDFLHACTRCGACTPACPTGIIHNGDSGYPAIDFGKGECTFCSACVTACPSGALKRRENQAPWLIRARISEHCLALQRVECRICEDLCEPRAIRFSPQLGGAPTPVINTERCTGCGACIASCPPHAIRVG